MAPDVAPPEGVPARYSHLSLWWDDVKEPWPDRPALGGDIDVDVCIVGAGFTGLWTAYQLALRDPTLRIAILEREVAGFGASGRNGGWCSALFATSDAVLARRYGIESMRAMRRAMQDSVDAVGAAAAAEGIDCHFAKGGTVVVARSVAQLQRAHDEIASARRSVSAKRTFASWRPTKPDAISGPTSCSVPPSPRIVRPSNPPSWSVAWPAPERRGVTVYEGTEVTEIVAGEGAQRPLVLTRGGRVRCDVVVRCMEAWTPTLPGLKRRSPRCTR